MSNQQIFIVMKRGAQGVCQKNADRAIYPENENGDHLSGADEYHGE